MDIKKIITTNKLRALLICLLATSGVTAFGTTIMLKSQGGAQYYRDFDSLDGIHYVLASEPKLSMWLLGGLTPEAGFTIVSRNSGMDDVEYGASGDETRLALGVPSTAQEGSSHAFMLPSEVYDENGRLKSAALYFNAETLELTVKDKMDRVHVDFTTSFENHSVLPVYGPVTFDFSENVYWNRFWLYDQPQPDGASGQGDDFDSYDYETFAAIFDGHLLSARLLPDEDNEELYVLNPFFTSPLVDSQYRVLDIDFSDYSWTVEPVLMITSLAFPEEKITIAAGESVQLQPEIAFVPGADTSDFRLVWSNKTPWSRSFTVSRDGLLTAEYPGKGSVTVHANDASGLTAVCEIEVTNPSEVKSVEPCDVSQPTLYFDLQGRRLASTPASGVCIEKRGDKNRKLIAK